MTRSQKKFHQYIKGKKTDGFLITKPENIFWLSGFRGSFGFFVQKKEGQNFLITDGRYIERAKTLGKKHNFTAFLLTEKSEKKLPDFLKIQPENSFFVENTLTFHKLEWLKSIFPDTSFVPQKNILETLRRQKTGAEIEKIKKAQNQVDKILLPFLKSNLRAGITEKELAFKLEMALRDQGKFKLSFPLIAAFGKNSSIPHHAPSSEKLKLGENILIDCGVRFEGFCSDMTRNFIFGEGEDKAFLEYYNQLLEVQKKCVSQFTAHKKVADIEHFCRNELGTLEPFFTHSLGHGIGLEIHEPPRISSKSDNFLQNHEVVTCEPGIYFPRKFGIRIEDALVIKEDGPEILTKTTKDLLRISEEGIIKKLNYD